MPLSSIFSSPDSCKPRPNILVIATHRLVKVTVAKPEAVEVAEVEATMEVPICSKSIRV